MSSEQVIGIDLGGTAIKLARFNRAGDVPVSYTHLRAHETLR